MHKTLALFLLVSMLAKQVCSQPKPIILKSDSTLVKIEIDGIIRAAWFIDPDTKPWTKPDVFRLEYAPHNQRVRYLSNRDSIAFMVKPEGIYNFSVLVKDRGIFPMQLTTFPAPVFQKPGILISLLFGIGIIGSIIWINRKKLNGVSFLPLGIISAAGFWLLTITGGFIHGDYNQLHQVVSELGAIGTHSEIFMSASESLLAILTALSIVGFYSACRQLSLSVIPVLTIIGLSLSMLWAAVFPMHHEWHGSLGPLPLILNAGALLAVFLWKGSRFRSLKVLSFISFLLMCLIILRTIPAFRENWEGLVQRLYYTGWTVWSVGLSIILRRIITANSLPVGTEQSQLH